MWLKMENEININLEKNNEIEKEQTKFFDTMLGKVVNNGLDFGLRAILPDVIENQVIEIKNALIENGLNEGIQTAVKSVVDLGKSVSGIFTGKFQNISQVQTAIGSGGVVDTFSNVLDKAINLTYQRGLINNNIKNIIRKGKEVILNNVTSNIKNELNYQENSIQYVSKYVNNFNEYFKNKDFEGMTKEYKKIESRIKDLIPLENVLKDARRAETLYNLVKNNGKNFNISEAEMELVYKLN